MIDAQDSRKSMDCISRPEEGDDDSSPVIALGHSGSTYSFLSPSGQVRNMNADALEAGRGVRALFLGNESALDWCRKNFPDSREKWSPKEAGLWIIEQCNRRGIYHADAQDVRSIGMWRGADETAVLNCGDRLTLSDSQEVTLPYCTASAVYTAGPSLDVPKTAPPGLDTFKELLRGLCQNNLP